MIALSPRLEAVAAHVPAGRPLADIGTDHAYLPAALIQRGVVPHAIAADVLPGPLEAARSTVSGAGLADRIDLRLGDGLQVLRPGEVPTVTICGMGGPLIAEILAAGPLEGVERLVLQPMGGEDRLRAWLAEQGWRLVTEELVRDAGRLYVILVAERGQMALDEADALVGPLLRRTGGELWQAYVQEMIDQAARALAGARRSDRPEAQERARQLERRIRLLKEVMGGDDGDHR